MEEHVFELIQERGPQTGFELRELLGPDGFAQWRGCMLSSRLLVNRVGRRYLRLDRKVEGYARLSPSILREFLTYSVVGSSADPGALEARTRALAVRIEEIGAAKLRFVRRLITDVGVQALGAEDESDAHEDRFCVLLAGDIVHGMAHDAPRPEKSTGTMVRGSDLDLVVVMDDTAPEELKGLLDDAIYQQKYRNLINPSVREEIDYTIKPFSKLVEQAAFDDFRSMVPCKIVDESILLYGSERLFGAAKDLLATRGIPEKLADLEQQATVQRQQAERHLLELDEEYLSGDDLYLFYTSDEREEFE